MVYCCVIISFRMQAPNPAAAQAALSAALSRCGLDQAAIEAVLSIGGIAHIAMLGMLAASDIARICKVLRTRAMNPIMIMVIQEQLMQGMHFGVTNRQRLRLLVDANDFTAATAFAQTALKTRTLEDDAREEKDQVAKQPDKFKKASEYKIFTESLDTYLGLLKGTGKIPLKYVIRRDAVPDPDAVYLSEYEQRVAIAPLAGPEFNRDNSKVYGIIKQMCLEGPGRAYVITFDTAQNGRGAFLALRDHFESDSFCNRSKNEAYATLHTLHYNGEKCGFTFEKLWKNITKPFWNSSVKMNQSMKRRRVAIS